MAEKGGTEKKKKKRFLIIIVFFIIILIILAIWLNSILSKPSSDEIKELVAKEFNINKNKIEIVFNENIADYRFAIGIVYDNKRSIVFEYNNLFNSINYIKVDYTPTNNSEFIAYNLVIKNGTNDGYYSGDNLIPSKIVFHNSSIYDVTYYDGYFQGCGHWSYGNVYVNIENFTFERYRHVK